MQQARNDTTDESVVTILTSMGTCDGDSDAKATYEGYCGAFSPLVHTRRGGPHSAGEPLFAEHVPSYTLNNTSLVCGPSKLPNELRHPCARAPRRSCLPTPTPTSMYMSS